jgi:hypothetical protein
MCFGEMMWCNVCPMRRIPLIAKSIQ